MAKIPAQDKIAHEMYEAATCERENVRTYLGMSQIGQPCNRALWYQFRGYTPNPIEGRVLMIFRFGDLIEEELVYWLKKSGYKVDNRQLGFKTHNSFFRGHCDGVVHGVTSQPHILECKSCNKKSFTALKKNGVRSTYPAYYAQCQCYMGYGGYERALVVVYCKDNSEIYTERIYFNRENFQTLDQRAYDIITSNEAPDRAFDDDCRECQWCSYRFHCREPEMAIQQHLACGNCRYCRFNELQPECTHEDHPYRITEWGLKCDEWEMRI